MNTRKSVTTLSLAIVAALGMSHTALAGGKPELVLQQLANGKGHAVPGELIVAYGIGTSPSVREAVRHGLGASKIETVSPGNSRRGEVELLKLTTGMAVADAVRGVTGVQGVEFAEPNWTYYHDAQSNDTYFSNGSLWGMYGDASAPANQYGSQAAEAWTNNHTDCSGVYVGVIDEGIYYSHEDLTANVWTNPYDPADGVDNDGNGYVDDTRGWDFDGGSNNINSGGANDDHGTHVSGTIAGIGNNGKGVAGVCWSGVKLISGKFLGRRGGTTANAIKAVNYFTDLKTRHGLNIVATNNSWGGGGFSQALSDAIDAGGAAGILFVAAAGNDSTDNDVSPHYPSNYGGSSIISVAALRSTGALVYNWGVNSVDIGAPGYTIWSTVPKSSKGQLVSGYAAYSGTSMATPHVTGAVALYAKSHPTATAADIKAAIFAAGVATPSLAGKVSTGKRLNASGF